MRKVDTLWWLSSNSKALDNRLIIARPINVCATKQRNCNMTSFVKKKILGKLKMIHT